MKILPLLILLGLLPLARGETVNELIKQGDVLDAKNENAAALKYYLQAEEQEPENPTVLRLISKQYAQQMSEAGANQEALGKKALEYAQRAVKAGPGDGQTHLSLAIVYGKIAFLQPPKERVEYSRLIKQEAQKAVDLDPRSDLAWHVLGRWNYEIANLSGPLKFCAQALYGKMPDASNERALECFERAVALNPKRLVNQAELGRTLGELGKKDEARAVLAKALQMPSREKDDEETKARTRKALAALD